MSDDEQEPRNVYWGIDQFDISSAPISGSGFGKQYLAGMKPGTFTLSGYYKPRAYPHFKPGMRVVHLAGRTLIERIVTEVIRNEIVDGEAVLEYRSRALLPTDPPRTQEQERMIRRMRWSQRRGKLRAWLRRLRWWR